MQASAQKQILSQNKWKRREYRYVTYTKTKKKISHGRHKGEINYEIIQRILCSVIGPQ